MSHAELHPSATFEPVHMAWYGVVLDEEVDLPGLHAVDVLAIHKAPLGAPTAAPIVIMATPQLVSPEPSSPAGGTWCWPDRQGELPRQANISAPPAVPAAPENGANAILES